jgi:FKBP-type peptidyl-prolyl cis-trans isomerase
MHQRNAPWLCSTIALAALALTAPAVLAQTPPAPAAPAASTVPATPAAPATPAVPPSAPAATAPLPSAVVPDEASSYSIGIVFGSQLRSSGLDDTLMFDAVMRGFKDGLHGKALGPEDKDRAMQLMRSGRDAAAARNRVAAHEFLAKNATAAGITSTESGLQYQVFEAGDAKAASPKPTDRVTVNYRGRLLDGTEFDNSDRHSQPATFGLTGIIKGWREALPMMKQGAKWRLFVSPELAYDANSPPGIPPGSLLIFDIELLKIEPAPTMSPQAPKEQKGVKPAAARKPPAMKPSP